MNSRLIKDLATRSCKRGEVTLASGRVSDVYIDCKQTFMRQEGLALCSDALLSLLRNCVVEDGWNPCEFVAGNGVGGGSLAAAMVLRAHFEGNLLDMLYVRSEVKDHGTKRLVEPGPRDPFSVGSCVAVVEDVITTGQSAINAALTLRRNGYLVEGILALVDRQEGGIENINGAGLRVRALFTKADILRAG